MSGYISKPPHYSCQRTILFHTIRSKGIETGNRLKEKKKKKEKSQLRVDTVHVNYSWNLKVESYLYKGQHFTGTLKFLNPTYPQIYYLWIAFHWDGPSFCVEMASCQYFVLLSFLKYQWANITVKHHELPRILEVYSIINCDCGH